MPVSKRLPATLVSHVHEKIDCYPSIIYHRAHEKPLRWKLLECRQCSFSRSPYLRSGSIVLSLLWIIVSDFPLAAARGSIGDEHHVPANHKRSRKVRQPNGRSAKSHLYSAFVMKSMSNTTARPTFVLFSYILRLIGFKCACFPRARTA